MYGSSLRFAEGVELESFQTGYARKTLAILVRLDHKPHFTLSYSLKFTTQDHLNTLIWQLYPAVKAGYSLTIVIATSKCLPRQDTGVSLLWPETSPERSSNIHRLHITPGYSTEANRSSSSICEVSALCFGLIMRRICEEQMPQGWKSYLGISQ